MARYEKMGIVLKLKEKCSECGKRVGTAYFRTKPVCKACFNKLKWKGKQKEEGLLGGRSVSRGGFNAN